MNRTFVALIWIGGFAVTAAASAQQAASYPDRPIRVIVPSSPGSPADLVGRVIGEKLATAFGQPLVFDNRPGATGVIGLETVAKSAANGYTLGVIAMPHAVIPSLVRKMPYDTQKDLAPVALVTWSYNVLVARTGSTLKSLGELVAVAKAKPGAISFSSGGNGTPSHLAGELLKRVAGIELTHVPHKGPAPAIVAVLTGDVDMNIGTVGALSPHIKAGKLHPLAASSPQRLAAHPDLPTFGELGYPGVQIRDWQGFIAPAGTPKAVIDRVHAEITRAIAMPDIKVRLDGFGMEIVGAGPEAFAEHIRSEMERWGKLVRDAGIRAD